MAGLPLWAQDSGSRSLSSAALAVASSSGSAGAVGEFGGIGAAGVGSVGFGAGGSSAGSGVASSGLAWSSGSGVLPAIQVPLLAGCIVGMWRSSRGSVAGFLALSSALCVSVLFLLGVSAASLGWVLVAAWVL